MLQKFNNCKLFIQFKSTYTYIIQKHDNYIILHTTIKKFYYKLNIIIKQQKLKKLKILFTSIKFI